jgi:hypothetical protein
LVLYAIKKFKISVQCYAYVQLYLCIYLFLKMCETALFTNMHPNHNYIENNYDLNKSSYRYLLNLNKINSSLSMYNYVSDSLT